MLKRISEMLPTYFKLDENKTTVRTEIHDPGLISIRGGDPYGRCR